MKKLLSFFLWVMFCSSNLLAQVRFQSTTFDHGTVTDFNNEAAVFTFTNTGKSPVVFLPTFPQKDLRIEFPNAPVMPGATATLLVYYYTPSLGNFNRRFEIYVNTSAKPIDLNVKGNIKSLYYNALTACPSMNSNQTSNVSNFPLTVTVLDKKTGLPIKNVKLEVETNTGNIPFSETNNNGQSRKTVAPGQFGVTASVTGYFSSRKTQYINRQNNTIVLELEQMPNFASSQTMESTSPTEPARDEPKQADKRSEPTSSPKPKPKSLDMPPILPPDAERENPKPAVVESQPLSPPKPKPKSLDMPPILPPDAESENSKSAVVESQPLSPIKVEESPVVVPPPVEPDYKSDLGTDGKLNEYKYNPNNLVFLIDISGSMNSVNRLPLLKASIKDMVMLLRPIDRVTVVTFATETEVIIDNVPVSELPEILEAIDGLRSSGKSFGRKGLDLAYEKASVSFIPGANNQVFLASDGLITASEEGMAKILTDAKYYAQRDIKTSVIGFGTNDASKKFMKKLASNGKGNFLEIVKGTNTEVLLVNEIKSQSLKKK